MGVAKSDFSQMSQSRSDLIKNAEHFARIDLDRSRFEKEHNYYFTLYYFIAAMVSSQSGGKHQRKWRTTAKCHCQRDSGVNNYC